MGRNLRSNWNSAGAEKVGVGNVSLRAFRRRIVRYWHLLSLLAPSIATIATIATIGTLYCTIGTLYWHYWHPLWVLLAPSIGTISTVGTLYWHPLLALVAPSIGTIGTLLVVGRAIELGKPPQRGVIYTAVVYGAKSPSRTGEGKSHHKKWRLHPTVDSDQNNEPFGDLRGRKSPPKNGTYILLWIALW